MIRSDWQQVNQHGNSTQHLNSSKPKPTQIGWFLGLSTPNKSILQGNSTVQKILESRHDIYANKFVNIMHIHKFLESDPLGLIKALKRWFSIKLLFDKCLSSYQVDIKGKYVPSYLPIGVNYAKWNDHGLNMNCQGNKILNYKILFLLLRNVNDHQKHY